MATSVNDIFKKKVAQTVAALTNLSAEALFPLIEIPKNDGHGDFSLPIPKLRMQGNPAALATQFASQVLFCLM